jgi:hypothetical protein
MLLRRAGILCAAASLVASHGSHESSGNTADSWAEWHMAEEHHLTGFDAPSFFTLHDFNSDGSWTPDEVRRMYGLDNDSLRDTPTETKDKGMLPFPARAMILMVISSCHRRIRDFRSFSDGSHHERSIC